MKYEPQMSVARRRERWLQWAKAYQDGATCESIAAKHGLGRTAVIYALNKLGVPLRGPGSVKGSKYRVTPKPKPYYPLLREQPTRALKTALRQVRRLGDRPEIHALALLIDNELRFRDVRRKPLALHMKRQAGT